MARCQVCGRPECKYDPADWVMPTYQGRPAAAPLVEGSANPEDWAIRTDIERDLAPPVEGGAE